VQAYEVMVLIHPDAEDARQEEIIARVREIVLGANGTWDAVDQWGRRKLAYEINHIAEAHYWVLTFSCDSATVAEITRVLKITDGVIRHMVTLKPPPAPAPAAAAAKA